MARREVPMNVRLAIAAVDPDTVNVAAFCREHGISRDRFYELRKRFKAGGLAGLEPRSRAPRTVSGRTPEWVEDEIVALRKQLDDLGLDAGPYTIQHHLTDRLAQRAVVPSVATIWRVLVRRGFVVPDPKKAPRRQWRRFVADRANECWQMDSTDYPLADLSVVKIISVIDDCSRLALNSTAEPACNVDTAWGALEHAAHRYGWPARLLRDNAREFQAHTGRLHELGIASCHSSPYHPQTCGKVERYQQTMLKYLDAHGPYTHLESLQAAIDQFVDYYNHQRPHRGINRRVPAAIWAQTPKSGPTAPITTAPTTTAHSISVNQGRLAVGPYRIQIGVRYSGLQATVLITGTSCHVFIDGRLNRHLTLDPTQTDQPLYHRPGRPPTP